jgi:hypothetical protein
MRHCYRSTRLIKSICTNAAKEEHLKRICIDSSSLITSMTNEDDDDDDDDDN